MVGKPSFDTSSFEDFWWEENESLIWNFTEGTHINLKPGKSRINLEDLAAQDSPRWIVLNQKQVCI